MKRPAILSAALALVVASGAFVAAGDGFNFGPAQGAGSGGSGDIEGVTAGDGLTGGGTSGTVELDVAVSGDALSVAADAISAHADLENLVDTCVVDTNGDLKATSFSGTIAAISTVTLMDPDDGATQTITISAAQTGDAVFSVDTTNLSATASRHWTVIVTDSGGTHALQFDADWKWIGTKPSATSAASAVHLLYLTSTSAAETGIVARWVVLGDGS